MTITKKYQMDPSLEIRKLSPRYVRELVQILETDELWKRLMSIIPKQLEKSNYVCNITLENPHKYHSEHFKLIENASQKYKRDCTEILLDEWGTSGRVRPALGHLLYLLTKAKLFRAADYVAVELLNQERPKRPSSGPEALIPIDLPEKPKPKDTNQEEIEKLLDEIDYPFTATQIILSKSSEAARHNTPAGIPQIVVTPDIEERNQHCPEFTLPVVVQTGKRSEKKHVTISDMIQFSTDTISNIQNESEADNRPVISQLLNDSEPNIPNFELMNGSPSVTAASEFSDSNINPAFSVLLSKTPSENNELPLVLEENPPSESNIPNFSEINNSEHISELPNLSIFQSNRNQSNDFVPDFDALRSNSIAPVEQSPSASILPNSGVLMPNSSVLMPNSSVLNPNSSVLNPSKNLSVNISMLLPTSSNSSDSSSKSRPCTSPLPNLSLNTLLPHFNYSELQSATNNFNENPYNGMDESGRFLGSGAFGKVFLALGLLDRPVAVKKLVLDNVEVVNVDDTVTKQFRNEVEVLSKYKHENLLSLLGYSCDGCTYCLMYEYIPGGALKDRLQAVDDVLQWKDRLNIAMGTARAVSYLHTAFSTPLIHRDIKSANILLDSKNKPKLGDFGLIKLSPSQNTNTATTVFGTSAYMSPEAFRGDVSVKMDTYSFGVVLLELLTSLPTWNDNREGTDLVTHIQCNCEDDNITPLLDKRTGSWQEDDMNFADKLFEITLKCLKEEKKKRPNMVEVREFLEDLLNMLHD